MKAKKEETVKKSVKKTTPFKQTRKPKVEEARVEVDVMDEDETVETQMSQPVAKRFIKPSFPDSKIRVSEIIERFTDGTFDYMYSIEMNRQLSTTHVHKLTREIRELYDLIGDKAVVPIYVVVKTFKDKDIAYVLDGQHRVQASIDLLNTEGIDIEITMINLDGNNLDPQDLVTIISTLNSSSLKWKNLTYIELFAKMGAKGYDKLLTLLKHPSKKYFASNLAALYTGSERGLSILKKGGKLNLTEGNRRKEQFDEIVDFLPKEAMKAHTLRAITTLLMMPEYNHEDFIQKFGRFASTSKKINTFPVYEKELLDKMKEMILS